MNALSQQQEMGLGPITPGSLFWAKLLSAAAIALAICSAPAWNAKAGDLPLTLPQSLAFSYLGHSCGGIQEHAYATGFDTVTGYPLGEVYLQTRCGGSGRGGGYHTTTYSAWVAVMWDFGGNVLASTRLTSGPQVNSAFSEMDSFGDELYNTISAAFLVVPPPTMPTDVTVVQSGDQFQVGWTANGVNPEAVISSTLIATPLNSTAPVLTATVTGAATIGFIPSLAPATTYEVTVVNTTIGGSSPASAPVSQTTAQASLPPSAPTGVTARWGAEGATTATLLASWQAPNPGDSPIDAYLITITGSDGGGTFTQSVSGSVLTASFTVSFIPDWRVTVRAHNASGWGPLSAGYTLGGL